MLVDAGTGNVLAGLNEHLRVPPASLTKVITALIAVGYLGPKAAIKGTAVSENAYPNLVGIEKGKAWPLDEVLGSLLVYSANDAAYALAEGIGGSLRGFVPVMRLAAREMGLSDDPVLHDPAGLDGTEGFEQGNLVSARDLAIAGRDLLSVPLLAGIVDKQSYDFTDPTGAVHDLPSMDYTFLAGYPGAIGVKTGFTDRAGDCLMAAARRHGRTLIAVVMDGYNPTQTAIDLLNQGFATPVSAEPTRDRLPPVLLPGPLEAGERERVEAAMHPPVSTKGARRAVTSGRARATGGASDVTSGGARTSFAGARAGGARARLGPLERDPTVAAARASGFGSVVGSWPAQVLLAFAGCGALWALWELAAVRRSREQPPP